MKKKDLFLHKYFNGISTIAQEIDKDKILDLIHKLKEIKKQKGRIFFLGIGGSAANCSHAVNDFRKLCNIECYTPLDNVSELTARINDEGWNTSMSEWLKVSNLSNKDGIFIFSVGGGNIKKKVSINLIEASKFAKSKRAKVLGIVGRSDGYIAKNADSVLIISSPDKSLVTPYSEAYQAVVWHALVSHPLLKSNQTKW